MNKKGTDNGVNMWMLNSYNNESYPAFCSYGNVMDEE